MRQEFDRAERLEGRKRSTVGFALTILQRRLASSPETIHRFYQTLLDKLETERQALGGQVFDVLGQVQFEGQSLKDLLVKAIRFGERPEVRAHLTTVVGEALDRDRLTGLMHQHALAQDTMETSRLHSVREEMERAEARRLQPHFIEWFFLEAFKKLGGWARQRESRRYQISSVPAAVRRRAGEIGTKDPVHRRYERIVFEKSLVAPEGHPRAAFVCPGHPLLDAVLDLTLKRNRTLLKRGAVLVDERDDGTRSRMGFEPTDMEFERLGYDVES